MIVVKLFGFYCVEMGVFGHTDNDNDNDNDNDKDVYYTGELQ